MRTSLDSLEATADLAACLRSALEVARPVELALIGSSRDHAVELAEQVEQIARAVHHLQLMAALAVDSAAPAPTAAGALVRHQDGPDLADDCSPRPGSDQSPSPYRRGCDLLRVRLRISGAEARRRIRTAQAVLPGRSLTGEMTTASLPILSALINASAQQESGPGAAAAGPSIGSEAISTILRTLTRAAEVSSREVVASVESTMVSFAHTFDPDALGKIGLRVLAHLDPDGHEPTEREAASRQGVRFGATWKGLTHLDIWADAAQVETLTAVFDTGSNPRSGGKDVSSGLDGAGTGGASAELKDEGPGGAEPEAAVNQPAVADRRTRGQLMLDALVAACGAALRVGGLREIGGLPAQVMVTVALKDLQGEMSRAVGPPDPPNQHHSPRQVGTPLDHLSGSAHVPHAGPIPVRLIRRFACDADVIPIVLGSPGQILDVGRATRLAPPHLRKALIARDHGCAFPGCAIPATWTEAHHIVAWYEGGATSLENLVLLCPHHHHAIHTGEWVITGTGSSYVFTPPWASMPALTRGIGHQIA